MSVMSHHDDAFHPDRDAADEVTPPGPNGDAPDEVDPSGSDGDAPEEVTPSGSDGDAPEEVTPSGSDGDAPGAAVPPGADGDAPFGFPVLAEVPELASMLGRLRQVDRLLADAIDDLILLQETSLSEEATGVAVEQWLAIVSRRTCGDRRMLATAAEVCRRLPSLHAAFSSGRVSWAQVRVVALKAERLPRHLDDRVDAALAATISETADADPDALARVVDWVLASLVPEPSEPATAPQDDVLVMQPRLDGSGGTIFGDFRAEAFAILDARLNTDLAPPGPTRRGLGTDRDRAASAAAGRTLGAQRAARLLELCTHACDEDGARTGEFRLLGRIDLQSLLSLADRHAQLLTHLAGGAMHVEAATARALADRFGSALRLIVHDEGRVVGVGRSSRQPPGWLTDATLALHDTCTEPGCRVAARVCDTDHARPWHDPARRHPGGRTDIDNLAPLCSGGNRSKEASGWRCDQAPDGARTWHHPRTGLTTRTLPATWRPTWHPPPPSAPGHEPGPPGPATPPGDPSGPSRPGWESPPQGGVPPPGDGTGPPNDEPPDAPDDGLPF
jgi:hypothetical protein